MKRRVLLFGAFALIILLLGSRVGLFKESQVVSNPVELKPEGVSDRDWSHFLQAHDIRKASNREIRFFGKVVDQHGDPVEGVEIPVEFIRREGSLIKVMASGKDQIRESEVYKTDQNGLFFIGGRKGNTLSIQDFVKEGYIRPRGQETYYKFGQIMKDPNSSEFHKADSKKPVTYVMWKKGETEPLYIPEGGMYMDFDPDKGEERCYINFMRDLEGVKEKLEDWDVELFYEKGKEGYVFSLKAKGNGGFQITEDVHRNLAPSQGYINEYKLIFNKSSGKYKMNMYYEGDGKGEYATFLLEYYKSIRPESPNRFVVLFRNVKINPAGSRNLEYDKSKRIRK